MCYCKLCNRFKINVTGDLRKVENVPDWLSKYLEKSGIIWCRLEYGHPVCFPVIFPWMLDNSMLCCGYYKPLSFTGVTWVEDRRVSKLQNPYGFLLKHPVRHGVTPEKRSLKIKACVHVCLINCSLRCHRLVHNQSLVDGILVCGAVCFLKWNTIISG